MKDPLIFDIKRSSLEDGPGLRTTVFLKGCNLNCFWCHNPEGKSAERQTAWFREKCMRCGVCVKEENISLPGEALAGLCPADARKVYGEYMTPEELLSIVLRDKAYYDATGGGVTFSGGECMLYPNYVAAAAALCREKGITAAIDTAGNVPFDSFEKVLPYADIFLYDVKCLDPVLHRQGTGVDNTRILENLERLKKSGKRIIVRIPEIPGFNAGDEVERTAAFCEENDLPYEILKYHSFFIGKKRALEEKGPEVFGAEDFPG